MVTIRRNTFETNSSSTHSICIPKNIDISTLPKSIKFYFGDFGWEESQANQAAYLYTAICNLYYDDEESKDRTNAINKLKYTLDKYKIEYWFAPIKMVKYDFGKKDCRYYEDVGSIDHCSELYEFLECVLNDEEMLIRYLIGGEVYTGNDNCCGSWYDDEDCNGGFSMRDCELAYDKPNQEQYDYFYKGN